MLELTSATTRGRLRPATCVKCVPEGGNGPPVSTSVRIIRSQKRGDGAHARLAKFLGSDRRRPGHTLATARGSQLESGAPVTMPRLALMGLVLHGPGVRGYGSREALKEGAAIRLQEVVRLP